MLIDQNTEYWKSKEQERLQSKKLDPIQQKKI